MSAVLGLVLESWVGRFAEGAFSLAKRFAFQHCFGIAADRAAEREATRVMPFCPKLRKFMMVAQLVLRSIYLSILIRAEGCIFEVEGSNEHVINDARVSGILLHACIMILSVYARVVSRLVAIRQDKDSAPVLHLDIRQHLRFLDRWNYRL